MSIRIENTSSGTIKVSASSTPTINVSKSSQVVKVNSSSPGSVKVSLSDSPIKVSSQVSPEVKVNNPIVRPFKAIVYQGPKGDPGDSGGDNSFLNENLTVTNPIGAATSGEEFQQGTSIEAVITEMLSPYEKPLVTDIDVSLTGLSQEYKGGTATELGLAYKIQDVSVTFENVSNLDEGTNVILKLNNTTIATKSSTNHSNGVFSFTGLEQTVQARSSIGEDIVYVYYTHTSPTVGTDAGATVTESSFHKLYHQKPCILHTSSESSNNNMSTFLTTASKVSVDLKLDMSQSGDREVLFSCDDPSIDENDKYVWIQVPEGVTIEDISVYTGANRGTWDATESFSLIGDGLSYTSNIATYNVDMYRSSQQRPFNRKNNIDINVSS